MLIYNRANAHGEKIMIRKYQNGQIIECSDNSYNFQTIIIRRLSNLKRKTALYYLCDVILKNSSNKDYCPCYIAEYVLDDITSNL